MVTSVLGRAVARGGYGALMRKQVTSCRWGAGRAFSVSPRERADAPSVQEKLYTENHEWVEYSSDKKSATVGVTKFAAESLGEVVYIELPKNGDDVASGDTFGAVESVKSASDLYSPVTGKVSEANAVLEEDPKTINKDPEGDGWIAKFDITGSETEKLLSAEEYKTFTDA